jgi:hypothetical protein
MKSWEKWYPIFLGFCAFIVYEILKGHLGILCISKDIFGALISISAIAIGFMATIESILLSLDNKIINQLKAAGAFNDLLSYIMSAINWSFFLAAFTTACLLIDFSKKAEWFSYAFAGLVFITIVSAASCYRIIRIFYKILHYEN